MTPVAERMGARPAHNPLRTAFLKWQCRARQMAMRTSGGRPDDAVMPWVILDGETEPLGRIITILNKAPGHSVTPELEHIAARTRDPAERRSQAERFLSAEYYQRPGEFADILTATFPPASPGAARMREAGQCRLVFDAYAQRFDLAARIWLLAPHNPLHRATIAHNRLFNPALPPGTLVLGFEPDWTASSSDPPFS